VKAVSDAQANDPTCLSGTGVTVAGLKYMYIFGDKQQVYAKKVRSRASGAAVMTQQLRGAGLTRTGLPVFRATRVWSSSSATPA